MFGITKRTDLRFFMTPAYLFVYLLIANQLLTIHSHVIFHNNEYQNQLENQQTNAFRQLLAKSSINSESSSDNSDLQSNIRPGIQRRFCCMSPLSGRKRFIRDLVRQKQE